MDLLQVTAPQTVQIVALRCAVGERDALDAFERHDRTWGRRRWRRRLRSIARILVPYHVFEVTLTDDGRHQTGRFAIDAVQGSLDPHRLDDVLETTLDSIDRRNCIPVSLAAEAAWPILADKLRRVMFQTGFFHLRNPKVLREGSPTIVHLPYWVGFYADGPLACVEVFDAVRRSFEGAKARALVEGWLMEDEAVSRRPAQAPSLPPSAPYPHGSPADR